MGLLSVISAIFTLLYHLHHAYTPDDSEGCACNQCINGDAIEHGRKAGVFDIRNAGVRTDRSQSADHQEFTDCFHKNGERFWNDAYTVENRKKQESTNKPGNDLRLIHFLPVAGSLPFLKCPEYE